MKQTARTWEIAVPLRTFGNPHTFCSISHKQTHLPGQLCCMLCNWGLRSWLSSCPAMLNLLDLIFHGVMLSSAFCHPLLHCDYSFTYIDACQLAGRHISNAAVCILLWGLMWVRAQQIMWMSNAENLNYCRFCKYADWMTLSIFITISLYCVYISTYLGTMSASI